MNHRFFYSCMVTGCKKEAYNPKKMKAHYQRVHHVALKDLPLSLYELKLQIDESQRNEPARKCSHCKAHFEDWNLLEAHVQNAHIPQSHKFHQCPKCQDRYLQIKDLRAHQLKCFAKSRVTRTYAALKQNSDGLDNNHNFTSSPKDGGDVATNEEIKPCAVTLVRHVGSQPRKSGICDTESLAKEVAALQRKRDSLVQNLNLISSLKGADVVTN